MKLEDYINKAKIPSKRMTSETKFSAADIDHYDNISEDKKELIKSVFPYLPENLFMDVIDRYENEISEYAYYRSHSIDGYDVLVRTKICDFAENHGSLRAISKDSFYTEYNKRKKVGAQKYADVEILIYRAVEDYKKDNYIHIYYAEDENVFLDSKAAYTISKMQESDLGKCLAKFCLDCMEGERRGYNRVRK